jgi:ComF family protein
MNTWITQSWQFALHALYPRVCLSCSEYLPPTFQGDICVSCLSDLYPLDIGFHRPNSALNHFYGRCRIQNAHAQFSFKPGGKIQALIHKIKYEGQTRLIRKFGSQMGRDLVKMPWTREIEAVICVPIHWQRWYLRGYNQGAVLARAIAHELQLPFLAHGLQRTIHTPSQTGLSRIQRVENLHGSIRCLKTLNNYDHVLIVDDVLTTGATVEACTLAIHEKSNVKVSLACLAIGGM